MGAKGASQMIEPTLLATQFAIGLVFLFSAASKVLAPSEFLRGVKNYRILPQSLAFGAGLLLIPLEIFLAVSHLSGWWLAFGAQLGLGMLASFAIAVTVNLKRGRVLPCYCFGGSEGEQISRRTLARLALLFLGELFLLAGLSWVERPTNPLQLETYIDLGLILLWSVFLLLAALWLLSSTDLIALFRQCNSCGVEAAETVAPRPPRPHIEN